MFRMFPAVAIALCSMSVSPSYADQNTAIRINLEEPKTNEEAAYSGISNLRGWAVAPAGIERVEIYVDGAYVFDVPMGGLRGDVGSAYPEYPSSELSGFSMAYNYKSLDPGTHSMTARAVDKNGDYNEQSVSFSTNRFISEYIGQPTDIDFTSTTEVEVGERAFRLKSVTIEGKKWDIGFIWDSATQGMELMSIQESDSN